MAGFQKIDKKQVPQVAGLGVLSVGLFGYFAYKMITPTASAAPTAKPAASAPAAPAAGGAGTAAGKSASAAPAPAPATPDAPPPTPGMRDPFVAAIASGPAPPPAPAKAPAQVASAALPPSGAGLHVPFAPALPPGGGGPSLPLPGGPGAGRLSPMPVAPPAAEAPAWIVTGVLQSDAANVAILRDGDARKFAHTGDVVGGEFRVVDVTRQFVVLQHGSRHYILPLGGPKPPAPNPAATPAPAAAATPALIVPPQAQPAGTAPQATSALPGLPSDATVNSLQQLAGKL